MKKRIQSFLQYIVVLFRLDGLLYLVTKNEQPNSLVAKLIPKYEEFPGPFLRVSKRGGIFFELDLKDVIDRYIYFGLWDDTKQHIVRHVKKNDVVFDVGANVGNITLNILAALEGQVEIHAFEPDPVNFKRLQANIGRNAFPGISLNNFGLGENRDIKYMQVHDDHNRGMNKIAGSGQVPDASTQVSIERLDDYITAHHIKRIDLIKVDVEGYELKVFKGAVNCLMVFKPDLIIEVCDDYLKEQGDSAQALFRFLEERGYRFCSLQDHQPLTAEYASANKIFDMLAITGEK